MRLQELMTPNPIHISPETPVDVAARMLTQYNIGVLPVCSRNGTLQGILTDRDMVTRCLASGRDAAQLRAADIMTTRVATVSMDDRLNVIKEIFEQAHFRHLLVLEEEELVGVISDRDLFRAISPYLDSEAEMSRDTETLNRRAHQIMSRHPITIAPQLTVRDGVKMMLEKNVSCLPVLENGTLCGMVSLSDLASNEETSLDATDALTDISNNVSRR